MLCWPAPLEDETPAASHDRLATNLPLQCRNFTTADARIHDGRNAKGGFDMHSFCTAPPSKLYDPQSARAPTTDSPCWVHEESDAVKALASSGCCCSGSDPRCTSTSRFSRRRKNGAIRRRSSVATAAPLTRSRSVASRSCPAVMSFAYVLSGCAYGARV